MTLTAATENKAQSVDHARLRILLVDDHAIVREGVRAVLEQYDDLIVVGECGSGDEALAACEEMKPDIAVLDQKMPGIGPVDTIRGLRQRLPGVRVLVFTSFGEDSLHPSRKLVAALRAFRQRVDAQAEHALVAQNRGDVT